MGARYRKIDPRIWNDEKFRTLSDDGKFAFLFLLTHPHMTALGAMRGTFQGLAAELGWTLRRFLSAAEETRALGIVEASEDASWIGIPNFLRYNEPEGPNSVTNAWVNALDLLPECQEKRRLAHRCRAYLQSRSDKFRDAIEDAIWDALGDGSDHGRADPCSIQEQEQEQEQEQIQQQPPAVDSDFEQFWEAYPKRNGKRLGKPEALRKWGAMSVLDKSQILIAVRNYANGRDALAGIGIRDPHRFLQDGKGNQPWREWLMPDTPTATDGRILTCSKRFIPEGERFLRICGQPASPDSRRACPRCPEHLLSTSPHA
jgi:hypothetical protein